MQPGPPKNAWYQEPNIEVTRHSAPTQTHTHMPLPRCSHMEVALVLPRTAVHGPLCPPPPPHEMHAAALAALKKPVDPHQ